MEFQAQIRKLGRLRSQRWILVVLLLAITHLMFQSLLLPYGHAIRSLLPDNGASKDDLSHGIWTVHSSAKSLITRYPLAVNASDSEAVEEENGVVGDSFVIENGGDLDENEDDEGQGLGLEEFQELNVETFEDKDSVLAENVSVISGKSDGGSEIPLDPSQLVSPASALTIAMVVTSASSVLVTERNSSIASVFEPKKMRCNLPPKTVTTFEEMNSLLVRHRAKSRSMRPRWSSTRDQEILAAKAQIERAPPVDGDRQLYAPLFRNVSMFRKSYELMERTLKVYVYKEGEKPIFHQPILKGLYASEGWFMKLMEGNRQFAVRDPRKAHLFYMPFSSRMLQHILYVPNSHNRTNLRRYLKDYSENIAAKYSYWNRTGGADHFLVACHDWAPYETRHHMERCMKALCNADVTTGFKIGRDVSLPETYVRSARNPLRDLGGKPPSQRHILAFYAGNLHGYLRPILLQHWKDKDPNMKIFGPMPPGVASKMNYIQHMKSSKYCLCPKGYEVNSPRVVEAIFYECVPVIISDNFVPPFLEVLNWEAFSIVLAEKDIPKLRDILVSIPKERYLAMQLAVRKAQRHFLWHAKPMKYDLFHMTLHSIWYNRVFQIKPR